MLLFALRVAAQFTQYLKPKAWLPQFSAWQSGTLPYPILLTLQVLVLTVGGYVSTKIAQNRLRIKPSIRALLLTIGAVYLGFMLIRAVLGIFLPTDPFWGALIPTVFHILLASWILLVAQAGECKEQT